MFRRAVRQPGMGLGGSDVLRWSRWGLVALISLGVVGCSRRPGLNFDCAWVPESPFTLNLRDEAHVRHLLDDLQTADELEIRYRDRLAGYRLAETFGIVSRHGKNPGAPRRQVDPEVMRRCRETLLEGVTASHAVTRTDIERLRPRLAHRGFDWPVTAPVVGLFLLTLSRFRRWLRQRFAADEWGLCLAVALIGAVVIPSLVLGVGWLWAMGVEIVRVGNEHMGHRARAASLLANFSIMFALGVTATAATGVANALRSRASKQPAAVAVAGSQ